MPPPKKKPRTSPKPSGRPVSGRPTRGPSKKRQQTFVFVEGTGRAIRPENRNKRTKRSQPKKNKELVSNDEYSLQFRFIRSGGRYR